MDIVFQSGDFFGESGGINLLNDLIMPIVSILVSVFIAVGIFKAEKKKEKKKEQEERKERIMFFKEHYKALGKGVIEDITKQISNYRESADLLIKHPFETPRLGLITLNNLETIIEMDSQLVLEMLKESKLSSSELIKLLNGLHFLQSSSNLILESFKVQKDQIIEIKNRMISICNQTLGEIAKYLGENQDNKDAYYNVLNKILSDYYPVPKHTDLTAQDPNNSKILDTLVLRDHYELKVSDPIIINVLKGGFHRKGITHKLISDNKDVNDLIYSIEQGNKDFSLTLISRIDNEKGLLKGLEQVKLIIEKL